MDVPNVLEGPHRSALRRWMDARHLGEGSLEVTPIGGGTQNTILRLDRGQERFVLRAPSRYAHRDGGRAIAREGAILRALARTEVPHPRLLAYEADTAVIGLPFLVTTYVDGFSPLRNAPPSFANSPDLQRQVGYNVVQTLRTLGRVRPEAVGLADLGYPDGWLDRQVGRWSSQLASYQRTPGYSTADLAGTTEIELWLAASVPKQKQSGLIHGDFHLDNMLATESGHVAAVVDWELSTQGDPMVDFAQLLVTWPSGAAKLAALTPDVALTGLPTTQDLIGAYFRDFGVEPHDLRWYCVFAAFRLAVLVEGTYVRSLVGRASPANGTRMHSLAKDLVEAAQSYMGGGPI